MKKHILIFPFVILSILTGFSQSKNSVNMNIRYTTHGNGAKKVIVLHSWMGEYQSWLPVIPHLNPQTYTYVFADVRGYGKSQNIRGEYTSEEIANDVFAVADDLGWDSFYLVGHSMTGMAVQKAAVLDKSNRIKKVIAITPVSSAGFPVDEKNMNFFKAIIQNLDVSNKAYRAFTSNRLSSKWYESQSKRHVETADPTAQLAYIRMWTGENFSAEMHKVETPFLVLAGQYDHPGFTIDKQKEAFENLPNAEFIEIENSGHFPMQETPVFLAAAIESYLGGE